MRVKTSEKGIYKEENGTYTVDTSYKKKRINGRGFRRLSDAKEFKYNSIKVRDAGSEVDTSWKYEDLEAAFLKKHLPKIRPSTSDRYLIDINYRIRPYFQFMSLSKINPTFVEEFQLSLVKSGKLSNKSINNCIGTLQTMFSKAEFWGMISKSPVRVSSLEVAQSHNDNWWDKRIQIDTFIAGLKNPKWKEPYRGAMLLALECGLRLGEIIGLNKQDVNFELCQIKVTKTWDDKKHKSGPTKSGKIRTIKFEENGLLHDWLAEALIRNPDSEALFTTQTGQRLIGRKLANEVFKKWKKRLDLPEITFHGLRHTFASWYMIRGGSIWDLYKVMGHSDFKTTVKKYAHLSSDAAPVPAWD